MITDKELERRERRVQRTLTLEELLRLNKRVDEFSEGRYPPGSQLEVSLDSAALTSILRLIMEEALRQRDYRQGGKPKEIRRLLRESQEKLSYLQMLPAEIAAIISQTYVELGDGAPLPDDEALLRWLADYLVAHPEHTTAVLARSDYIGMSRRALEAYLSGRYFLPREKGGEGGDTASSRLEPAIRAFRSRVQSVEQHGNLGSFVETGAWKFLQHACDTAINENAIVVVYGRPGVGKTRCLMEYASRRMTTLPISIMCSPNTTPFSFVKRLAHLIGANVRQQTHLTEEEIVGKLNRSPKPLFIDQANYLDEKSLGTLCFLWERQHLPMVLTGTKHLYDTFFQSKLTEEVRGQLSSRIALHYLLPELSRPHVGRSGAGR